MDEIYAAALSAARAQGVPPDGLIFMIISRIIPGDGIDYSVIGTLPASLVEDLPKVLQALQESGQSGTRQ